MLYSEPDILTNLIFIALCDKFFNKYLPSAYKASATVLRARQTRFLPVESMQSSRGDAY